ncbi:DsbA family oxidoreductase [Maritalea mobilis]|uniref:DsbA family oxidoreductase n=1 Tax=Maritalea mobilis TaxID=483324 RepID=UPI0021BC1656|nr:DsbA family oxidoreductase [Maritalea mobilis]
MPIRVDIVSDVVCPWCVIGYHQLAAAAAARRIALDAVWHPFELNPGMAEDGENLREHLAAKYGTTPEESRAARDRLTTLGASLGFTFDYADDMRMWNTFRAHQLIDWANEQSRGHDMNMALFAAFFSERRNISDNAVLSDVAASAGLDRDAALGVLERGDRADRVREKERFWTSRGITGVPAMVFQRQHLVVGAQGEDAYGRILDQLAAEQPA